MPPSLQSFKRKGNNLLKREKLLNEKRKDEVEKDREARLKRNSLMLLQVG